MAHVKQANKFSTTQRPADRASGYEANGASEYSRQISSAGCKGLGRDEPIPESPLRWRTTSQLIERTARELKKTHAKLKAGGLRRDRIAKLASDVDIKTRFLVRLRAERAEMLRMGAAR